MVIDNLLALQNGSDVRGVALKKDENAQITLSDNATMKIVYTFIKYLREKTGKEKLTLAVGRDSRVTGEMLAQACCVAAICSGCAIYDCGLCTTPAMFMTCIDEKMDCDGAVMVTASHLPFDRNGLKFFTKEGGLNKEDITAILTEAETIETSFAIGGSREAIDYLPKYSATIVNTIREKTGTERPLEGAKIIVDAGNGSGGFFAEQVLQVLGADTEGSQFLEPDGNFPNHVPNPEDETAMASACQAVLDAKADMGIIFDTDVDRAAIIDEKGNAINRNAFIAFISNIILSEHPGSTIVTDSVTSTGLTEYIEKCGGKHHRFKRGYKNVINEAIRLNEVGEEAWLAMETSGHGAVKENYFLDDGAYLVTMALAQFAKLRAENLPLSSFLADLKQPAEAIERRYNITEADFKVYGQKVLDDFAAFAAEQPGWTIVEPNYEGVRISCDETSGNGWVLMRLSLHDPKMPVNIESDEVGGCAKIEEILNQFVQNYALSL